MIRVVVADDESLARERLCSFLSEYPDFTIEGQAQNGEETVRIVNDLKPDVLFLDIEMPRGDGFTVIDSLNHVPIIIFATAFDEYAIQAFNKHALDYLLKPFSKERFKESMDLIRKLTVQPEGYLERTQLVSKLMNDRKDYLRRVTVRNKFSFKIIPVDEISSIKTSSGLVFISSGGDEYQTDTSLGQFEGNLDPQKFMRIHRTAIVNLERITKVMPWGQGKLAVVIDSNESLQVSRDRMKEFKTRIGLRV